MGTRPGAQNAISLDVGHVTGGHSASTKGLGSGPTLQAEEKRTQPGPGWEEGARSLFQAGSV